VSLRVHSRYERRLLDTAIGGCEVVICLAVRRFMCLSPECAKVTFAEQTSRLTSRHGRRTPAVTAVLQAVALALGGRAGAEFICRDRAGCYADGGARGAPDAVRVADRWHLWHNLGEAVERAVSRHREHWPTAVAAQAAACAAAGRTLGEIAAVPGLSRNTIRRFARAASPEELLARDDTGRRPSILDEHAPYLHKRWDSGCTNAALLWQEIRARGYQGSCRQVRGYLARPQSVPLAVRSPAGARGCCGTRRPESQTLRDVTS